jgi:hypothetical protein
MPPVLTRDDRQNVLEELLVVEHGHVVSEIKLLDGDRLSLLFLELQTAAERNVGNGSITGLRVLDLGLVVEAIVVGKVHLGGIINTVQAVHGNTGRLDRGENTVRLLQDGSSDRAADINEQLAQLVNVVGASRSLDKLSGIPEVGLGGQQNDSTGLTGNGSDSERINQAEPVTGTKTKVITADDRTESLGGTRPGSGDGNVAGYVLVLPGLGHGVEEQTKLYVTHRVAKQMNLLTAVDGAGVLDQRLHVIEESVGVTGLTPIKRTSTEVDSRLVSNGLKILDQGSEIGSRGDSGTEKISVQIIDTLHTSEVHNASLNTLRVAVGVGDWIVVQLDVIVPAVLNSEKIRVNNE